MKDMVIVLVPLLLGMFADRMVSGIAKLSYWHRVGFVCAIYVVGMVMGSLP